MPRPVVYPNVFGQLSGTVSASLLDQNFNADGSIINDSSSGWVNAAIDTGSVNSYIVTLNPPAASYQNGFFLSFLPLNANTGPSSINVNGLGNVQILKQDGSALTPQTLIVGTIYSMVCINGAFRIIAPNSSVIVGEVQLFAGATPPSNWLFCNGNAVSRTQYLALFGIIGTTFGVGDGSTTFNVPNFTNRMPTSTGTLGAVGGSNSTTLTVANLPAHSHAVSDPGHTHAYVSGQGAVFGAQPGGATLFTPVASTTGASLTGIVLGNTGSGTAITNIPAYLSVNFIIRAF